MKVVCTVTEGPFTGQLYEFDRHDALLIGRGVHGGLKLKGDPLVSRNHCVLEFAPPRCRVRDLGSRNGTFVNSTRVEEAELRRGDQVRIGKTVIRIDVPETSPAPAGPFVRCSRCGKDAAAGVEALFSLSADDDQKEAICQACRERPDAVPEVFPGHRIVRKLGEGAVGAVYLAATQKNEPVAIKTLRPQVVQSQRVIATFVREALLGAQIEHPNAVRVLGSGYSHGLFYFVMEYVEGPDLEAYLRMIGRPLTLPEAAPIMGQLLDVLDFAHGKKLVHRDVKPANILLRSPPPQAFAKLADFGLMRKFEGSGASFITKTGQGRGTPYYMPPEQLNDAKNVGPPADLYALASTFFYVLSGEHPLAFSKTENPLLTILEGEPRSLSALVPAIPLPVSQVIARCLEKDPRKRFASAREMKQVLGDAIRGSKG